MTPAPSSTVPAPHIAVFTPHLGSGGAERMSLFVTDALAAAGMRVDLIVTHWQGVLRDHPTVRAHGVNLGGTGEWAVAPLLRYYRRERPQLILAMGRTAKFVTGLASQHEPSLPFVISVRGVLERPRPTRFWPRALFGHAPERWLYRRAIAAQVTLQAMADQVARAFAFPPDRIAIIHNPVLLDRPESPLPPQHEAWFDRPVLVTAGRLEAQKDHAAMLRAFAASGLANRARLLILGVGPLEAKLRRQAGRLGIAGAVTFGGYVPDVRPYLERSAGFVLTSVHESFGLVLLEALGCNLPVASYDCPTGPEELLGGGRFGRLVPLGDEAGMARAMRDIVDGTLTALPPEELAQHLERFAPATIAAQWPGFIRECLARVPA